MEAREPYELRTFSDWWDELVADLRTGEGWWAKLSGELSPGGLPINSTSLKYENARTVKAGAGSCFGLTGYNSNVAAQFILVFDVSTPPANGAVPVAGVQAAAASDFSIDWGLFGNRWGRAFQQGIYVANSSTRQTLTAGSADCWFDVQYI